MTAIIESGQSRLSVTKTRGGAYFDPNNMRWTIREGGDSVTLNFEWLTQAVTPEFLVGFKKTLIWYAENKSLRHFDNMFKRAEHLFRHISLSKSGNLSEISGVHLLNYQSDQPSHQKYFLGALAGFIKKWYALGYGAVTKDAIAALSDISLPGNEKGAAVLTMDPHDGPYTDIELEAIQIKLNANYASGIISKSDYILAWLFMLLGQRPIQYALLKTCDVTFTLAKDGSRIYSLMVPRGKQHKAHRREFKERLITPQVGRLLDDYAREVEADFRDKLKDESQAPLFPQLTSGGQPAGMEYHRTSRAIALRLTEVLEKLAVSSERTGDLIHVTATRFRRTIGTRAAREGHGELVIAELLDHTDTQNVGVYVQATPEIVERIDRALAMTLAPLAQAFAGTLITDESKALHSNDPSRRIFDPRIERSCRAMGSCGSHGFCGFNAPIACYTCHSFQAWVDGPHEEVLAHLLADRERKLATASKRVASVNDRTIYAVAEVIQQCAEMKNANGGAA